MDFLDLGCFKPISLENMSAVKLMNRVDTKYVTTVHRLVELLKLLRNDYFIQDTGGLKLFPYHTVYFDTPERRMYTMHLCGKKCRQKIRMRTYVNSGQHFLEIKRKNNKGRTKKKRIPIECMSSTTSPYADFIASHSNYESDNLVKQIENRFNRITLVNRKFTERLTIDTALEFHNTITGIDYSLPNIVIIELKRDGATESPALKHLQHLRIFPSGFSKYCMGMVFTTPGLRVNRFKERSRMVTKMNAMM